MDIIEILTKQTEEQFGEFAHNLNLKINPQDLAERYIRESCTIEPVENQLLAIELRGDKPGRLIKFNSIAAAGFIVSLIGGIAGANNPVVLGSVIVNSFISLSSLIERTTQAEGALFWVVYELNEHEGKRDKVQLIFNAYCKKTEEIKSADFHAALRELIDLGIIEQRGEILRITDKCVFVWYRDS